MKNILLVDDHVVIRKGLGSMLNDYYSQSIIFEAGNGDEALNILKQNRIDLVILDLQMPNTNTINVIELISIKYPRSYILVFFHTAGKNLCKACFKGRRFGVFTQGIYRGRNENGH